MRDPERALWPARKAQGQSAVSSYPLLDGPWTDQPSHTGAMEVKYWSSGKKTQQIDTFWPIGRGSQRFRETSFGRRAGRSRETGIKGARMGVATRAREEHRAFLLPSLPELPGDADIARTGN